jgi:hypothetical protein
MPGDRRARVKVAACRTSGSGVQRRRRLAPAADPGDADIDVNQYCGVARKR